MHFASFFAAPENRTKGTQRHPRTLFSTPVRLQHLIPGGVRLTRGITLDISEGGLGALMKSALPLGETVSLELELPDYELRAVAIVRHSSSSQAGFEFLGLTPDERERIARLVASA